jgi:hypothetical protein
LQIGRKAEIMAIEGYVEYRSREFCKDVKCPVQLVLNSQKQGSEEYEKTRKICSADCKHTTWEFHHWLIDKGYIIVRPEK